MTRHGTVRHLCFALAVATLAAGSVVYGQQPLEYQVKGLVLTIDESSRSFVVSHDAIPGVMPAMTMPFEVRTPEALRGVVPGSSVRFRLVMSKEAAFAEQVQVVAYQSVEQDPLAAGRLKLLKSATGSKPAMIGVQKEVPDFTLIDQANQRVSLSQFRGKVVAVNFIYTSCALPQFCYRIANHFGVVQKRLQAQMGRDLVLLTISFDPARDSPEVLAAYGKQWAADPSVWHFLTGPRSDIARICGMFGVDFFPDEGLLTHSLHTAVIDRQGRLVANIEGNQFTAAQLGDLVEATLSR